MTEYIAEIMSESAGSNPAPPLKKKGMKPIMIVAIVIIIVVLLVGVVVLGGFFEKKVTGNNLLEKIKNRGKIIVGTQVPYEPFESYNTTSGIYYGVDIEIMTLVAERLGVGLEFKSMEFDPLFGAVQTGVIDVAISSITITSERQLSNSFSVPYYTANQAVLVRESSTIATINDLNGTKIVAQTGTTGEFWAEDNLSPGSLTMMGDVPQAAMTVETGSNDVFIVDTPVAYKYANDPAYDLKVAFIIHTNENYGIMMPLNEPELNAAVNQIVSELISYGTVDSLVAYWMD
jgi:ABC-type amino acid transport substrate-binding protein